MKRQHHTSTTYKTSKIDTRGPFVLHVLSGGLLLEAQALPGISVLLAGSPTPTLLLPAR